jgi:hypothetical protein
MSRMDLTDTDLVLHLYNFSTSGWYNTLNSSFNTMMYMAAQSPLFSLHVCRSRPRLGPDSLGQSHSHSR